MTLQLEHELELRKRILDEMIAEVAASIRQYERTLEGLRQRIEAEKRQHELLEQKRSTMSRQGQLEATLSIADYVAKVLWEQGEPMHIQEIVRALQRYGVATNSDSIPLNSVMSALSRRADLFQRIGRGRYALRDAIERRNHEAHSHRQLEGSHS